MDAGEKIIWAANLGHGDGGYSTNLSSFLEELYGAKNRRMNVAGDDVLPFAWTKCV